MIRKSHRVRNWAGAGVGEHSRKREHQIGPDVGMNTSRYKTQKEEF